MKQGWGGLASKCCLISSVNRITHCDSCPEMLAAIRRGGFATPTEDEFVEYLLQRKPWGSKRPAFEDHSLEHVISYQRRIAAFKRFFLKRDQRTPLGIVRDWLLH